jgi:uncharacterized damage-inducible protein DinB
MFSRELFVELYRHMEWADATVWNAVPADGPPDPRLRQLMLHVHVVQRAFLHVWTDRPIQDAFHAPEEFLTLADLRLWARPYYQDAAAFVATLTPEMLQRPVVMPWAAQLKSDPGLTTLGDTCFQATSHTTYHRGQVNLRLRELGVVPPLVDYIAWLWLGKPEPVWNK